MPKEIPHVDELGVSSAPLKSASFYIGSFCKPYSGKSTLLAYLSF
jgi:NADH dehydrogenase (ubiquinone) 1 alpha subcomplex subunit 8